MPGTDAEVIALLDRSRIVSALEQFRTLCEAAVERSMFVGRWHAAHDSWKSRPALERRRRAGMVVFAAVLIHVVLLWTSSGFHKWVVFILPAIFGAIAVLAIVMGSEESVTPE